MKHFLLLTILIGAIQYNFAQDIDVYKKDRNDNYKMPKINEGMTYEEFELLSQNMRMKDMLYASIMPGYVHFKANDKKTGYWLVGIRSASFLTILTSYNSASYEFGNLDVENLSEDDQKRFNRLKNAFYIGIATATASYVYDVMHGDAVLHRKQEKIRYKYSIKPGKHATGFIPKTKFYPNIGIAVQF